MIRRLQGSRGVWVVATCVYCIGRIELKGGNKNPFIALQFFFLYLMSMSDARCPMMPTANNLIYTRPQNTRNQYKKEKKGKKRKGKKSPQPANL